MRKNYVLKAEMAEKKVALIGAYESDGNWKEMAEGLDISMRTAYCLLDTTNDTPNNRDSTRRKRFYYILVS